MTTTARPTCQTCDGTFTDGEEVIASDWKVFDLNGGGRMETRYRHVACAPTDVRVGTGVGARVGG